MRGVAMGLGLPPAWFEDELTREPTVLFRIFRYPPRFRMRTAGAWASTRTTDC